MAKGAYVGVSGKARKIKKGYVGVNGVARKIKKAYIGIGGKARPCWSGGELAYYGTVTSLSVERYALAATSVGNYALFGGGEYKNWRNDVTSLNTVDAYNSSLTISTPTVLSEARQSLAATTIGNYALFGGGEAYGSNVVDAYNTSLTISTPTRLSEARGDLAAITIGNYALFGGGSGYSGYSRVVDAYNASLTRSTPSELNNLGGGLAAATNGTYAIFIGGHGSSGPVNALTAYNTSLTKQTLSSSSYGKNYRHAGTGIGNYALFGGGMPGSISTGEMIAIDKSLTLSSQEALSMARHSLAATTLGDYALFSGGQRKSIGSNIDYPTVTDAYDTSLTRTSPTGISCGRHSLAATTVGDYAIFGGGNPSNTYSAVNSVDAYTLV